MFDILKAVEQQLFKPKEFSCYENIIPTVNPSSAMTYTKDGQAIGSCIRQVWFDKKHAVKSNPMGIYSLFITEAGPLWENWLIEQYKKLNIYVSHSVKIAKASELVVGELDIVHKNPENGTLEITEVKQYNASNWFAAKELLGDNTTPPKPKDQNLLQCVRYLMITTNKISTVNLIYLDRSCKSFYNNKQFTITLTSEGYAKITTLWNGSVYSYIDERFTTKDILEKENLLYVFLKQDTPPPPDYSIQYTPQQITQKYTEGLITKKIYDEFLKDPLLKVGDWMCQYCAYGRPKDEYSSTCDNY